MRGLGRTSLSRITHYCGKCWSYTSGSCEKHPQAEQIALLFPHSCYYACRDKVEVVNPRPGEFIARCPHMKATSNTPEGARGNFWIAAAKKIDEQEKRFVSTEDEITITPPEHTNGES